MRALIFINSLFNQVPSLVSFDNHNFYLQKDNRIVPVSNTKFIKDNTLLKDMVINLNNTWSSL